MENKGKATSHRLILGLILTFLGSLAVCQASPLPVVSDFFHSLSGLVCHHQDSRTLEALPVWLRLFSRSKIGTLFCPRCWGIWLGFSMAYPLLMLTKTRLHALIVLAVLAVASTANVADHLLRDIGGSQPGVRFIEVLSCEPREAGGHIHHRDSRAVRDAESPPV